MLFPFQKITNRSHEKIKQYIGQAHKLRVQENKLCEPPQTIKLIFIAYMSVQVNPNNN